LRLARVVWQPLPSYATTAEGGAYFRTMPRFETGHSHYAFSNRLLAVGIAKLGLEGPVHVHRRAHVMAKVAAPSVDKTKV